jgi:hypothetical protein
MTPPYDIFRIETDGSVSWQDAMTTLEKAKARIEVLAVSTPAQYLIQSNVTGRRIVITQGASTTKSSAENSIGHDN